MKWDIFSDNRTKIILKNSKMMIYLCYYDKYPDKCSVSCKKISYSKMFTAHSIDEAKKIAENLIVQALRDYQKKLDVVIEEIEAHRL